MAIAWECCLVYLEFRRDYFCLSLYTTHCLSVPIRFMLYIYRNISRVNKCIYIYSNSFRRPQHRHCLFILIHSGRQGAQRPAPSWPWGPECKKMCNATKQLSRSYLKFQAATAPSASFWKDAILFRSQIVHSRRCSLSFYNWIQVDLVIWSRADTSVLGVCGANFGITWQNERWQCQ